MKEKQKNTEIAYNVIIVLLILVIAISAGIGIFAWAKYQTTIEGTAIGEIAKWSFKVVDGDTTTSEIIDFPITRTDNNTSVAKGRLAPGTYGQFEIGIDASGTETYVQYTIKAELNNKPRNLKFYSDSEKTNEIEVVDNVLSVEGFMSLEDVNEVRTETIYWDWKYETGGTDTEIGQNDIKDTEDSGKLMTMQIAVTGTEVLEAVQSGVQLGTLNLGDYVDAGTMLLDDVDGVVMEKYEGNKQAEWRVAKKEGDTVTLILSDYLPNRHLSSVSGISLNSNGYTVGWPDLADANEAVAHLTNSDNWKSLLTGSKIEAGTIVGGLTEADITDEFKSVTNMFTPHTVSWNSSNGYWLASARGSYFVRLVRYDGVVGNDIFGGDSGCGVRPAVTLKSDILLENVGENIYSIK
ncbi:MAG: hypothetical protein E7313_03615 [Clostridiales bacterium]|nr:hypothetical protein [Clostridiales bacterium]